MRCSARSPGKQACPRRTLVPCHVHGWFRSVLWLPFGAKPHLAHLNPAGVLNVRRSRVARKCLCVSRVPSSWFLPACLAKVCATHWRWSMLKWRGLICPEVWMNRRPDGCSCVLTTLKTRWKSAACWRDGCGFAASFELCVLASHTSRARRRRAPVSRRTAARPLPLCQPARI